MLKKSSINCLPFLEKQIVELGSKIIIPLGEHPTRILFNEKFNKFADVVGKVYEKNILGKNVLIIPIYHPSPINPKGYKNNLPIFEKIKELI